RAGDDVVDQARDGDGGARDRRPGRRRVDGHVRRREVADDVDGGEADVALGVGGGGGQAVAALDERHAGSGEGAAGDRGGDAVHVDHRRRVDRAAHRHGGGVDVAQVAGRGGD